jgi:hypothetical protein
VPKAKTQYQVPGKVVPVRTVPFDVQYEVRRRTQYRVGFHWQKLKFDRLAARQQTNTFTMAIVALRHRFFAALFAWWFAAQFVFSEQVEEGELSKQQQQQHYGTEVSWPMQRRGDFAESTQYRNYMQGCYDAYNQELCERSEAERIAINLAQPAVQRNFTAAGYAKVPAPASSYNTLRQFWDLYHSDNMQTEDWDEANIYTNHWEAATRTLLVDTRDGPRLHVQVRRKLVEDVQSVLERWSGVPLQPTSLYGIRSYGSGSILAPHVDR